MARFAIVILMLLVARPAPAVPCRVGSSCRGHLRPPASRPTIYVRASRGALPVFSHAQVMRFLTAAPWDPIDTTAGNGGYGGAGYGGTSYGGVATTAPRIRFITADVRRLPKSTDRFVVVRRIARRAGVTMIEVDGAVFGLARCAIDTYRANACLTLRTDLSFDDPEEVTQHFAKPPPG
jgi:hypothetical protein